MESPSTQRQLASLTAQLSSRQTLAGGMMPQCSGLDVLRAGSGLQQPVVCSGSGSRPSSSSSGGSSKGSRAARGSGGSGGGANFNFSRRAIRLGFGAGGGAAFLVRHPRAVSVGCKDNSSPTSLQNACTCVNSRAMCSIRAACVLLPACTSACLISNHPNTAHAPLELAGGGLHHEGPAALMQTHGEANMYPPA